MQDYGHDFHQTMIAKIEAAQRPLRVRELADFAALYDVEIQELIYPPSGSPEEASQEMQELEARREKIRGQAMSLEARLRELQRDMSDTHHAYESCERDLAVLDERLDFLRQETGRFRSISEQAAIIDEEIRRRRPKGASGKD
jgi:chromosome segregation ATPase